MNAWGWISAAIVTVAAFFCITPYQSVVFGVVGAIAFVVLIITPLYNRVVVLALIISAILIVGGLALAADKPTSNGWSLYTRTFGGTISIVKNLTKAQCEKAKKISMPELKPGEVPPPLNHSTIIDAECYQ